MTLQETPHIYGFGSAALDFRIIVADLGPNYRDKLLARKTNVLGGGSVANCLVQIARLGGHAFWLGKLGNDWIGNKIIEMFRQEKVNTSHIITDSTLCSPFNVAIYTENQNKRIGGFLVPNSLTELTDEEIILLASYINQNDWVIVEIGEIPLNTTLKFCREVKKRKGNLVIDVDLDPVKQCIGAVEEAEEIFSISDFLVPNFYALQTLYSPYLSADNLAKTLADEYKTTTIITVGADGVFYCQPGGLPCHHKAFETNVVDTVGAGDSFHGGLLYGLANGRSLSAAIKLGSYCAALKCQRFGAREGMPTSKELTLYEF